MKFLKQLTHCRNFCSDASTAKFPKIPDIGYNFELSSFQRQVKEAAREFTKREIIPKAAHHDKTAEHPSEIHKKAWEAGFTNLKVPEYLGGPNYSMRTGSLIGEEFSYGCTGINAAVLVHGLAQQPLIMFGTREQQKKYLGRMMDEPLNASYCVTEAGTGSDVASIKTRAEKKGNEWILNGQKMWITNAGVANWYFVLARSNPDPKAPAHKALSGFLVDRDTPGLTLGKKENKMGQRASDTRGVSFEDVRIPEENLLLGEGAGFEIAMKTFDATRSGVSIACSGLARRCLDEASRYASERTTFGAPIIEHQAVASMLANMAISCELIDLGWKKTVWEYDHGIKNTYIASISKLYASEAANKVAKDAVQIFGGNGYSSDYPVEKLMRDAKVMEIFEGTNEIQKIIIGRLIKKKVASTSA